MLPGKLSLICQLVFILEVIVSIVKEDHAFEIGFFQNGVSLKIYCLNVLFWTGCAFLRVCLYVLADGYKRVNLAVKVSCGARVMCHYGGRLFNKLCP